MPIIPLSENNQNISPHAAKQVFQRGEVGDVFIVDPVSMRFIDVSESALLSLGYSRDELLELGPHHINSLFSSDVFFALFNGIIRSNNKKATIPGLHKRKDNTLFEVEVNVSCCEEAGKILIIASTNVVSTITEPSLKLPAMPQDVTEHKLGEQELSLSEKNYRLLFDANPVPLWMLSFSTFRFLEVNLAAVEQYSYAREELLKLTLLDLRVPDEVSFLQMPLKNYEGEKPFEGIARHRKKNGELIFVHISCNRIVYKGMDVWLTAAINVTEAIMSAKHLKDSQQQLSLIYNSIVDSMWLLNVEDLHAYRIASVNDAYANVIGMAKEKAIGRSLDEVVSAHDLSLVKAKCNETVQTRQVVNFFTTTPTKNGEITTEIRLIPILNEQEKVVQLLGIANNVTAQQKSRKNLVRLNIQLRELASHLQNVREEERVNIAREIHDELGQQLTGIKMDISWLGRKLSNEDENIRLRINLLLKLVDGTINTVRKIAAELRPSILDDLGLAEAIEWQSQEFTKRTGVPVRFWTNVKDRKFDAGVSIHIFRILQESLTNVARHANASNVTCELLTYKERLLLVVTDDGAGFDMNQAGERKTLGLLGMKERVTMINGKYEIVSQPLHGTSISIEVPLFE